MIRLLTSIVLVGIFTVVARGASPLLNYEQRVKHSIEMIERLKKDPSSSEGFIEDVERLLPKTEQVESKGQVILVDNAWLHSLLDSYNSKTAGHGKRADLDEAESRLQALRDDLLRMEDGESKANGSVENPRDSVNQILSGPAFQDKKEDPIAAYVRRAREAVGNFFLKILRSIFRFIFGAAGESGSLFKGVVIFVAVAALAAAGFMLARWRPARKKKKTRLKQIILDEEIDANKTSADLMNDGLAAARSGDFRLGIRRLYIALLYGLAERNLIELDRHATNYEYLGKIASIGPLEPPARYLTERFDYFWYGRFAADQNDFAEFKARLDQATTAAASIKSEATAGFKPGTAAKRS